MIPPDGLRNIDFLLNVDDLTKLLKVSKRTVWRWVEQGRLPPPVRYSRISVRWRASDIQKHLADKNGIVAEFAHDKHNRSAPIAGVGS